MSQESFTEFLSKLNSDEALFSALTERFGDLHQEIPAEQLIDFAGQQGYEFSVEEAEGQLSEKALEGVAGGISSKFVKFEPDTAIVLDSHLAYSPGTMSFKFIKLG